MAMSDISILGRLDKKDKEKVSYFMRLLLDKSKYQALKKEIVDRRQEIESGETLSHEAIWEKMNV